MPVVSKALLGLIPLIGLVFTVTIMYFKSKKKEYVVIGRTKKGIEKKSFFAKLINLPLFFCWVC